MRYFEANKENKGKYLVGNGYLDVSITAYMKGLHWIFTNSKGETLSVILHEASYGGGCGLFEVMPSWYDNYVEGYLTFGEVQKWINELKRRETKNKLR